MLKVRKYQAVKPKWVHEDLVADNIHHIDANDKILVSLNTFKFTQGCPYDDEEVEQLAENDVNDISMWVSIFHNYYYARYDRHFFIIKMDNPNVLKRLK